LNRVPRWLWLLALLIALVWYWHGSRPIAHPPGILVAESPLQQPLSDDPAPLRKGDVAIKPLATFALTARVLGRADYHWDGLAPLAPVDLALGWGACPTVACSTKYTFRNRSDSTSGRSDSSRSRSARSSSRAPTCT
jgi:hypothetical protein